MSIDIAEGRRLLAAAGIVTNDIGDLRAEHFSYEWSPEYANFIAWAANNASALLAALAEAERDAARYRWLRMADNASVMFRDPDRPTGMWLEPCTPEGIDAAIDAALNPGTGER